MAMSPVPFAVGTDVTQWALHHGSTDVWASYQPQYTNGMEPQHTGITVKHWKDQTNREACANRSCGNKFSLFTRCHHCRRCGEVFCSDCLNYQRRLNFLAHPDPNGRLYKVCKSCFDKGPQTLGQTRRLLDLYQWYKDQGQRSLSAGTTNGGVNISNFREKLHIDRELGRLKQGFNDSIQGSGVIRAISSLLPSTTTPEWQKAPYHVYGKMSKSCTICSSVFSLTKSKRMCVVCGAAVCKGGDSNCSTSDLLVYLPDETEKGLCQKAEIALVKIVGCPPKEPKLSEYLAVCQLCRQTIEDRQVAKYHQERAVLETSVTEEDFWPQVEEIDTKLRDVQKKVDEQLPKYQELIEALEAAPPRSSPQTNAAPKLDNKSNTQVLAKAQSDLGDHLTTVAMTIQSVRRLKPQSAGQGSFIRNFLKAKCDYYHENMYLYRDLKRKLELVTPLEVLAFIQATVDKNAINSCYIALRQLAFEALHLCSKHQLDNAIVTHLVAVEDVVEKELQVAVQSAQESWEDHSQYVNELVQQQLTTGNHRIVRVSNRRISKYGKSHVHKTLVERSVHTLKRVYIQLCTKCADKSFTATKAKVKEVAEKIHQGEQDVDWILV